MNAVVLHEVPTVRRKVTMALRGDGWQVMEAGTGEDGIALASGSAAALVFCAFRAQEARAAELIRRLRAGNACAFVIALGEPGADDHRAAMDCGADDYLPVSAAEESFRRCARARWERRRALLEAAAPPAPPGPELLMAALFRHKRLGLTHRESEVLAWIIQGKGNRDLAALLEISPRTVEKHVEAIYGKLGVETRAAAMLAALDQLGLLQPGAAQARRD